jgi:hypothetical protein
MIGIGIGVKQQKVGGYGLASPVAVATAATGIGATSFTANWDVFTGALYYLLDVSTNINFTTYILQSRVSVTNSYLVRGLTSNTTYYYRVRAVTTYEATSIGYFGRVSAASGYLTPLEKASADFMIKELTSASLLSQMRGLYPMLGSNTNAMIQNLMSSSFTASIGAGYTASPTGLTSNGTSGFDTNANMSIDAILTNCHFGFYTRIATTNNSDVFFGCSDNFGTFLPIIQLYPYFTGGYIVSDIGDFTTRINVPNVLPNTGFTLSSRTSVNSNKVYRDGIATGTNTLTVTQSTLPNADLFFFGYNSNGIFSNPYSGEGALASFGLGLDDTEAANFSNIVEAFQQNLNRAV